MSIENPVKMKEIWNQRPTTEQIQILMNYLKTKCPLCEVYYRTKVAMRFHLRGDHLREDAEKFIENEQ